MEDPRKSPSSWQGPVQELPGCIRSDIGMPGLILAPTAIAASLPSGDYSQELVLFAGLASRLLYVKTEITKSIRR